MNHTKVQNIRKTLKGALALALTVLLAIFALAALPGGNRAYAESDGTVRVKLTRLGTSVSSLTMTTVGGYTAGGATIPSGTSVKASCSGSTVTLSANGKTIASGGSVTMKRTAGGTGVGVRFTSPAYSNLYCGDLTFTVSGGSLLTVLTTYVETYLYGVVPYEMSNSYPLEALKAQAVAARTYAMRAKHAGGNYDLTDNASSQVFRGYNASYTNAIGAVDATRGMVLMWNGAYAQCYYTASNGGQIESTVNAWGGTAVSYLTVKDDPYDRENPNSILRVHTIPKDPAKGTLNASLKSALISAAASQLKDKGLSTDASKVSITEILSVEPHTPRYAAPSRTYTKLRFVMKLSSRSNSTGNQVSTQVEVDLGTYSKLEAMLGLSINSSDNEIVVVEETGDSFKLTFGRYGHGIGLSQRGAQWMAKQYGKTYKEILEFYYPGTKETYLSLTESPTGVSPQPTRAPVSTEDGYSTLQEGDSGEAVKAMQTRLKELGYFTGTPLGNYKTLTVSAVKAYQKAMGLNEDGVATPALQKMIFGQTPASVTPAPSATVAPAPAPSVSGTPATISLGNPSSRVNVRKGAGTNTAIMGTLANGAQVTVVGESGKWSQIQSGNLSGYVMTEFLKKSSAPQNPESGDGYRTLQYGDSGEAVLALQKQLKALGYFTGTPLGNYKTLTTSAVQAYQAAMGLAADGIATPQLQQMILSGQTPQATPAPQTTTGGLPQASGEGSATVSLGSSSSRLNVRASASASSSVSGTLRHGTQVEVLSTSGGWSRIRSGSLVGYVNSVYLVMSGGGMPVDNGQQSVAPETASGMAMITLRNASSRLNVRKEANTTSGIVGTLRHGVRVEVISASGGWTRIRSGSLTGYVMSSYLTQSAASSTQSGETSGEEKQEPAPEMKTGRVAVDAGSNLNVRKSASLTGAIVARVKSGASLQILATEGEWYRIRTSSGQEGYVKSEYVKADK